MLWTALPLWWLSLILFNMVPRYGGFFSIMTGASLIIGNIIWARVRNPLDLAFPMYFDGCRDGASDHTRCVMRLHYSWCFWLCLVTGILCVIIGVVVVVMDLRASERLVEFFNVDSTRDLEEFVVTTPQEEETDNARRRLARHRPVTLIYSSGQSVRPTSPQSRSPGSSASPGPSTSVDDVELQNYQPGEQGALEPSFGFRKRTTRGLSKVQKTRKTQRPDSFYPPDYERENPTYAEARSPAAGVVNDGVDAEVDVADNELYVNARHS